MKGQKARSPREPCMPERVLVPPSASGPEAASSGPGGGLHPAEDGVPLSPRRRRARGAQEGGEGLGLGRGGASDRISCSLRRFGEPLRGFLTATKGSEEHAYRNGCQHLAFDFATPCEKSKGVAALLRHSAQHGYP